MNNENALLARDPTANMEQKSENVETEALNTQDTTATTAESAFNRRANSSFGYHPSPFNSALSVPLLPYTLATTPSTNFLAPLTDPLEPHTVSTTPSTGYIAQGYRSQGYRPQEQPAESNQPLGWVDPLTTSSGLAWRSDLNVAGDRLAEANRKVQKAWDDGSMRKALDQYYAFKDIGSCSNKERALVQGPGFSNVALLGNPGAPCKKG